MALSARDISEFNSYLLACTDRQVYGVLEKEEQAGRKAYAELAREELKRRNLE